MDAALHNLHLDGFFIKEMMWHLSLVSDSFLMFIHLQFQVFIFYQQPFNFNGQKNSLDKSGEEIKWHVFPLRLL